MRKILYAVIERKTFNEEEKSFISNFIVTRIVVAESTLTLRRDVLTLFLLKTIRISYKKLFAR
jgi:hypothetical protein